MDRKINYFFYFLFIKFLILCIYEDDVAAVFTSFFRVGSGESSMSCAGILEHSIDNTYPTWFLAPTDCSKIPAQKSVQCRPFNWR